VLYAVERVAERKKAAQNNKQHEKVRENFIRRQLYTRRKEENKKSAPMQTESLTAATGA
jgi:hypothetical protein